ncbi:helix-turn-helix transcriptional regulator, partial [Micromonospora sp. NPDC048839]
MADSEEVTDSWRGLGHQLAQLRKSAGHTQHVFAGLVQYGRSSVANTETGRQQPDRAFWVRCDAVLQTGGILAQEYDRISVLTRRKRRASALRTAARPEGPTPLIDKYVHRPDMPGEKSHPQAHSAPGRWHPGTSARHLLPGSSHAWPERLPGPSDGFAGGPDGTYVGVERSIRNAARVTTEHAMDAGAWAVSDATIEQLCDDATRVARDFARLTPAVAVSETLRVRNLAVSLLERTRRPGQQRELYLIVAQAAALLASESVDLGLWPSAMEYARAAYTYGEVAGHDGVRAYARGMQATIAYWTGQTADAVEYAETAVALAPAGVARVRALAVLARAWSHRGAADNVRRAVSAAEEARGTDGQDLLHDIIGGEFGYTPAQQARSASTAWLEVGHAEPAIAAAVTALNLAGGQPGSEWSTVPAEARAD